MSGLEPESDPTRDFQFRSRPERIFGPSQCAPSHPQRWGLRVANGQLAFTHLLTRQEGQWGQAAAGPRKQGRVLSCTEGPGLQGPPHPGPGDSAQPRAVMAKEGRREQLSFLRTTGLQLRGGRPPRASPTRAPSPLGTALGVSPTAGGSSQRGRTHLAWVSRWWNPRPRADAGGARSTWRPTPAPQGRLSPSSPQPLMLVPRLFIFAGRTPLLEPDRLPCGL